MKFKQVGLVAVLGTFLLGGGPDHEGEAAPKHAPPPLPVVEVKIQDGMPLLGAFQAVAHTAGVALYVDPDLFYSCTHHPASGDEMGKHSCKVTLEHLVNLGFTGPVDSLFMALAAQMGGAEVTTEWRDGGWIVLVGKAPNGQNHGH